mmetsp:Transcript_33780/g.38930  ORF Transcript_33780/g.38930 Transcript_33780/m.38930 type:complete len:111 (-) Transcript_33780:27-359(-)
MLLSDDFSPLAIVCITQPLTESISSNEDYEEYDDLDQMIDVSSFSNPFISVSNFQASSEVNNPEEMEVSDFRSLRSAQAQNPQPERASARREVENPEEEFFEYMRSTHGF